MVGLDPATLDDDNPSNHTFSHGIDQQSRYRPGVLPLLVSQDGVWPGRFSSVLVILLD